tara:strand:+ start:64 stop:549 length:486 start_codon:yes stop_codon:yes gene_type:complete
METDSPDYYYHPYTSHLRFDVNGNPYTNIKFSKIIPWEPHPVFLKYEKSKKSPRYKISLRKVIAEDIYYLPKSTGSKETTNQSLSRLAAEAFFNQLIPKGLQVCHINGIPTDNSKNNLVISDIVNNAIDEVIVGRQITNIEQIDIALERLTALKTTYGIIN